MDRVVCRIASLAVVVALDRGPQGETIRFVLQNEGQLGHATIIRPSTGVLPMGYIRDLRPAP